MATWNIDPAHSAADFVVKHMMFTKVRGNVPITGGVINFDPANPADASVEATLDIANISTGAADRDTHLKSDDFFSVETFPTMTFKSTGVDVVNDNNANITGDLTIRDVTKSVVLAVEFQGAGTNPWGQQVAGFEANITIDREDFGLTWNQALETGGVLVGKEVKIELDIQAAAAPEGDPA
ncbi:MAG: YceI family protein [Aggregatilineales bacterium]